MSIAYPIDSGFGWPRFRGALESRAAEGRGRPAVDSQQDQGARGDFEPGSLEWEQVCVEQAMAGNDDAFGALVDFYAPRLASHLGRMTPQKEDAEDLVQEAFIRAYRFLHQYDGRRPFRNWLYTIATNTALNALRARRRRGWTLTGSADAPTVERLREMAGGAPGGDDEAQRNEKLDALEAAIRRLPPQSAMLVQLHYQEGMTIREAAKIVGLSEGGARVALFRARKSLREWVVEEES